MFSGKLDFQSFNFSIIIILHYTFYYKYYFAFLLQGMRHMFYFCYYWNSKYFIISLKSLFESY